VADAKFRGRAEGDEEVNVVGDRNTCIIIGVRVFVDN